MCTDRHGDELVVFMHEILSINYLHSTFEIKKLTALRILTQSGSKNTQIQKDNLRTTQNGDWSHKTYCSPSQGLPKLLFLCFPRAKASRNLHQIIIVTSIVPKVCLPVFIFRKCIAGALWKLNYLSFLRRELKYYRQYRPKVTQKINNIMLIMWTIECICFKLHFISERNLNCHIF